MAPPRVVAAATEHTRPRPDAVLFDLVGTLFDLCAVEDALAEQGAPTGLLEAWLERILHSATSLTLSGEYEAFASIARATLATTAARLGVRMHEAPVLEAFGQLSLRTGARDALNALAARGISLAVLTNSGAEQARALLARADALDLFTEVLSVDDVRRYKPDPETYEYALSRLDLPAERACFVAAHAWDVLGAERAGLRAVWIACHEHVWPLPVPARETVPDLAAAAALLGGET